MSLERRWRDRRHAMLVVRARRGDGDAFRRLYRDLFPKVTSFLGARLASPSDVEDLTSAVFHRLLEHLGRFDPERGSVLAWVLTMAHHALVDHFRRSGRVLVMEPPDPQPSHGVGDPLDRLLRDEQREGLESALARLEPATRRMLELRYQQGLSHREIAELFAVREDTIKQRFSRAHRRLRASLERRDSAHA